MNISNNTILLTGGGIYDDKNVPLAPMDDQQNDGQHGPQIISRHNSFSQIEETQND